MITLFTGLSFHYPSYSINSTSLGKSSIILKDLQKSNFIDLIIKRLNVLKGKAGNFIDTKVELEEVKRKSNEFLLRKYN
jgi:hypothetical protein